MIKAILFDLDGVLVDAVEWHYKALNRALSLFGYSIGKEDHESIYNGLPTATKLEMLSKNNNLSRALHPFINELKQQYTKQIISSYCCPDIKTSSLLRHLKAQGYLIGLASNSNRATVDLILERMAVRESFDVVLSRDDVKLAKPNPEIYERCFNLLRLEPEECLIIEDSLPGIEAAKNTAASLLKVRNPKEVTLDKINQVVAKFNGVRTVFHEKHQSKIEIVIPMAGLGQRFSAAGFDKPKPFIDVFGKPMIQWVIENVCPQNYAAHFTFICNQNHLANNNVEKVLSSVAPNCSIIISPGTTEGAACTLLLAAEQLNHARPLLIANSDQWVGIEIDGFLDSAINSECDGMIMTFPANANKWSYAKIGENQRVTEVAEKNPISPHATVGIYYFKHAQDFLQGAEEMIRKEIRTNGEFYVCPVYNQLIKKKKDIRIYEIPQTAMHGLGTPEDLQTFLRWKEAV